MILKGKGQNLFFSAVAVALVSALVFFTSGALKAKTKPLAEPARTVQLSPEELALVLPIRTESSGWNLVHFMDYACDICREAEEEITVQLAEAAPNVGRSIMLWPNPTKPDSAWPARAVIAASQISEADLRRSHANLVRKTRPDKDRAISLYALATKEEDIFKEEVVTKATADWEAMMSAKPVTDHLTKVDALAQRLGLLGVPAYLLVSPTGEGWIVGSLEDWKKLVKEKGLASR